MNFREKEGGSLQSKKFVAKKHNIVFRNEGGGTAVKPLVYLFLIMASTKPQKLLFRGVPGVSRCVSLVRVCNYYQFPCRKEKKIYLATHSLTGHVKFVFFN